MVDEQKLFNKALKEYTKINQNITELCSVVQQIFPEYSTEVTLKEYDYLLQNILLKQALADGSMNVEEVEFINSIVNHGDILQNVKEQGTDVKFTQTFNELTWSNVYALPNILQNALTEKIEDFVSPYANDFALFMGMADAVTKKDYFKRITNSTGHILDLFARIDGEKEERELQSGAQAYCDIIANKYLMVYNLVKDLMELGLEFTSTVEKALKEELKALEKEERAEKQAEIKKNIRERFFK